MKKKYSSYLNRMHLAERKLTPEDRTTLEEYLNFCRLTAGEDKVQQRKRYVIRDLPFNVIMANPARHTVNSNKIRAPISTHLAAHMVPTPPAKPSRHAD